MVGVYHGLLWHSQHPGVLFAEELEGHDSCCLHSSTKKTLTMPCSPTHLCILLVHTVPLTAGAPSPYCAASDSMVLLLGRPYRVGL